MPTDPGFPKNACIQIHHLPSDNKYQSVVIKVYNNSEITEFEKMCELFTKTDAFNCSLVIDNQQTFFPAGVLQQSVIRLIVTDLN